MNRVLEYFKDFVISGAFGVIEIFIFGIFFGVGDRAKGGITVDTPGAWTALEYPRQVVPTSTGNNI